MLLQIISDILLLFGLGLLGWFLLSRVRMPASELIGPVIIIGTLRTMQVELPTSPNFLFFAAQVVIGIFVGSMLSKDTVSKLKPMALSALIIIAWVLSTVLIVGIFLARYSVLDLYTAMLSASMGGLPEITVIALASGAEVGVVMAMQMIRLLITVMLFPLLLKLLEKREYRTIKEQTAKLKNGNRGAAASFESIKKSTPEQSKGTGLNQIKSIFNRAKLYSIAFSVRTTWLRVFLTIAVATAGGLSFSTLGVPAGLLVGSTIFVAVVSVAGLPLSKLSPRLFDLLFVFIGITVADNISVRAFSVMFDPDFLTPILLATAFMFASSFAVAWIIYRLTNWDFPTSFLAAAPGGFTVMTSLAIKHGRDPFKVSMLHLCRLLSINIFIPFVFMFLMRQ